eukprot:SM000230S07338  [mRNA]  locus=s230:81373:83825:- [translate_table: standard]
MPRSRRGRTNAPRPAEAPASPSPPLSSIGSVCSVQPAEPPHALIRRPVLPAMLPRPVLPLTMKVEMVPVPMQLVPTGSSSPKKVKVPLGTKRPHLAAAPKDGDSACAEGGVEDQMFHSEKKRRLTMEQVRLLEQSFDEENKLEPSRKVLLARQLGLQPRQVAVWFQNRRARRKTKVLERDFDSLQLQFNAVVSENERLCMELRRCRAGLCKPFGRDQTGNPSPRDSSSSPLDNDMLLSRDQVMSTGNHCVSSDIPNNSDIMTILPLSLPYKECDGSCHSGLSEERDGSSPRGASDSALSNLAEAAVGNADKGKGAQTSLPAATSFTSFAPFLGLPPDLPIPLQTSPIVRTSIAAEEGSSEDDCSCNFFLLPDSEDQPEAPWWDGLSLSAIP